MAEYGHLSFVERELIAILRVEGLSLAAIARRLGRVTSTISREIRRNALPKGGYQPIYAEGSYRARRQRPAVLECDRRLRRFVHQRLLEAWTPEQIAGWLKRGEERKLRALCLETIYAFHPSPRPESRAALAAPAPRARQAWPQASAPAALPDRRPELDPRAPHCGRRAARGRPLGRRPDDLQAHPAGAGARGAQDALRPGGAAHRQVGGRDRRRDDGGVPAPRPPSQVLDHLRQRHRLRPARPAPEHVRHDDLVLRRLRGVAEKARSRTPTAGSGGI